jgi:TatD DNase family protein
MQDRHNMPQPLYDAHNHLQDLRLAGHQASIRSALSRENIVRMVVNGSAEADWPDVLALARQDSCVIPSFGYHPWYVRERSAGWQKLLVQSLDQVPSAIGEVGLDRWIKDHDMPLQEEMFVWQLHLASERNLPVSIHCLQAWGRLFELLRENRRPEIGFVLHSFGGPGEMVPALAKLGAYFSLPGHFAHERKTRQRETFKTVPLDRLLIETDAPDQLLPDERVLYPLSDLQTGKPLNHPGNLRAVYTFASELLGLPCDRLTMLVQENFLRLFGQLCR